MSIFGMIKDAIWGKKKVAPAPTQAPAAAAAAPAPAPTPAPAPAADPTMSEVDVEAHLGELAAQHGEELNWRTSIVDLMKLVGIDPSLHNREELAKELGYTGALGGSAEMNIWLHKHVMAELAKHGGKVPANMLD